MEFQRSNLLKALSKVQVFMQIYLVIEISCTWSTASHPAVDFRAMGVTPFKAPVPTSYPLPWFFSLPPGYQALRELALVCKI